MNNQILSRLKSGQWTAETARRFKILAARWLIERGPRLGLLTLTCPLMSQAAYQPKGWCWYDAQDGLGSPGLKAKDKRQHLAAGALVGSWAALLAEHWGSKHPWIWGLVTGMCIGYLKEVYDMRRGSGTGEIADALWTGVGGGLGASVVFVKVRW